MSGLPESVERIVVEALAKQNRYARRFINNPTAKEPDSGEVTREILLEVADRVEDDSRTLAHEHRTPVARWLRSQAQERDDEDK